MNDQYWVENYNTRLGPEEEVLFSRWVSDQSKKRGRDMARDLVNYDLRGYWSKFADKDTGEGHLPDTFKKPNHPSFSEESIYHGTGDPFGGNFLGGRWVGDDRNGWSFQPTNRMLATTHTPGELRQYFADNEPEVMLLMPTTNMRR